MSRTMSEYSPDNIVMNWASARGKVPFTSAQCFDEVKNIDEIKAVSDALGRLYSKGLVSRRKVDGLRFEYVWHSFAADAGEDFALCSAFEPVIAVDAAPAEPSVSAEIPPFLRKDQPAAQAKPEAPAQEHKPEQPQSFSAEAIAEALIRKLKPVLQAQFATAALESTDAITEPCSRVTLRIEKLELTVEGLL